MEGRRLSAEERRRLDYAALPHPGHPVESYRRHGYVSLSPATPGGAYPRIRFAEVRFTPAAAALEPVATVVRVQDVGEPSRPVVPAPDLVVRTGAAGQLELVW